jgi:phosphoglycerate dehydrogenase-like enzyme
MRIRATSWGPSQGQSLFRSNILIIGAGGITLSLLSLLEPFRPTITILRRRAEPLDESVVPSGLKDLIRVATLADLDEHVAKANVVVAACALTPDTRACLAKTQFSKMQKHAIVVNVARGEVIKTDDLVEALQQGQIGGAGLDVTDPEPLPASHALWSLTSTHEDVHNVEEEKGGKRANLIIVSFFSSAGETDLF